MWGFAQIQYFAVYCRAPAQVEGLHASGTIRLLQVDCIVGPYWRHCGQTKLAGSSRHKKGTHALAQIPHERDLMMPDVSGSSQEHPAKNA